MNRRWVDRNICTDPDRSVLIPVYHSAGSDAIGSGLRRAFTAWIFREFRCTVAWVRQHGKAIAIRHLRWETQHGGGTRILIRVPRRRPYRQRPQARRLCLCLAPTGSPGPAVKDRSLGVSIKPAFLRNSSGYSQMHSWFSPRCRSNGSELSSAARRFSMGSPLRPRWLQQEVRPPSPCPDPPQPGDSTLPFTSRQ